MVSDERHRNLTLPDCGDGLPRTGATADRRLDLLPDLEHKRSLIGRESMSASPVWLA
jgi:hypothetical protein